MFCKYCGKELEGTQEICLDCQEKQKTTCPYCGAKVSKGARFCDSCDAYLGNSAQPQNSSAPGPKKIEQKPLTKMCKACHREIPANSTICPICKKWANVTPTPTSAIEGSYWAGFLLSFLLGLIGFIIALAIDKEETKRGAKAGIIWGIIIAVFLGIIVGCSILNSVRSYPYY